MERVTISTEREYIASFQKVVEGEAAAQLEDMVNSDYNLEKILKFWAGIYGANSPYKVKDNKSKLSHVEKVKISKWQCLGPKSS